MIEKIKEKIYAYALKNAIEHEGKAEESKVISALFHEGLKKEDISKIINDIKEQVKKVNFLPIEEQKKEFSNFKKLVSKREERVGLQNLPNAKKGKVVLRLAPYPSGALHLGNAKTYLLNALYAEKYKGKLLLIIDDTIGSKEKKIIPEAYKLIPEAFDWLKVKYKKPIIHKSDRLKIYYKYAEELINLGKAYVCSCSQQELQKNRKIGRECSCRQFPSDEQIKRWKKIFSAKPGDFTLRLKTSMQDANPAFRDRVLFRISNEKHPKIGKKFRVWPMLEFSWAIDDYLLGITHILRGKDLMIESDMEKFIWDIFGWKHPEIIHCGLIRISGLENKISKSKAQKEVLSGQLIGWDDPRTWSVQSLRRRGFLAESIREFVESIGLNSSDIIVPIESLYAINRKLIDLQADRYFFISEPIKLKIENSPKISEIEIKIHPDKKEKRKIKIGNDLYISRKDYENFLGKEIRLMHLFNIEIKGEQKAKFTSSENKNIHKLQWISDQGKFKEFSGPRKSERSEDFRGFMNARILMPEGNWISGVAEKAIKKLKSGKIIQFERIGFVRFDKINEAGEYEFWFAHM